MFCTSTPEGVLKPSLPNICLSLILCSVGGDVGIGYRPDSALSLPWYLPLGLGSHVYCPSNTGIVFERDTTWALKVRPVLIDINVKLEVNSFS